MRVTHTQRATSNELALAMHTVVYYVRHYKSYVEFIKTAGFSGKNGFNDSQSIPHVYLYTFALSLGWQKKDFAFDCFINFRKPE